MWFSQAEAQFRRARITAETTMYDYILMKLPQDVVMSVRSLVSAIEADPVKQERSYTLMKEALLGSYGMTKWQMAYALLDHPDLGVNVDIGNEAAQFNFWDICYEFWYTVFTVLYHCKRTEC